MRPFCRITLTTCLSFIPETDFSTSLNRFLRHFCHTTRCSYSLIHTVCLSICLNVHLYLCVCRHVRPAVLADGRHFTAVESNQRYALVGTQRHQNHRSAHHLSRTARRGVPKVILQAFAGRCRSSTRTVAKFSTQNATMYSWPIYTVSQKSQKTSHLWLAITLTHMNRFLYFSAEMLPIK